MKMFKVFFTSAVSLCLNVCCWIAGGGAKLSGSSGWFEGPRWLHHRHRQLHERGTGLGNRLAVVDRTSGVALGWAAAFKQEQDFFSALEKYEGKELKLYVYNTDSDNCREVLVTPPPRLGRRGQVGIWPSHASPALIFFGCRLCNNSCC